jgi:ribonuclease HI
MESVIIYTDGGCSGNPGPGGWAFVIRLPANHGADRTQNGAIREVQSGSAAMEIVGSGGEEHTTNNRMELRAIISSLEEAERRLASQAPGASVVVNTDSQYVKNGITSWIASWKRNGWRTADKKPVKNKELWEELDQVNARMKPRYEWVKGHAGVEDNERCDAMVQTEIAKFR